jgi:hypothetical protein
VVSVLVVGVEVDGVVVGAGWVLVIGGMVVVAW